MTLHKLLFCLSAGCAALALFGALPCCNSGGGALVFSCAPDNDLYTALAAGGRTYPRFEAPGDAIAHASRGAAVLILADGYPDKRVELGPAALQSAARKRLKLYIEYPLALEGLDFGAPRAAVWERAVVTTDGMGANLPRLRLLAVHGCRYLPAQAASPLLVLARVAGYDTAVYGLPKEYAPLLFEWRDGKVLVATTKLSGFVTGRYAPAADWRTLWEFILGKLDPDHAPHTLRWTPVAGTAYGPQDDLPQDAEARAFSSAVNWLSSASLLVPPSRKAEVEAALRVNQETAPLPAPASPQASAGDGSLGSLEGFASGIQPDGTQLQRLPIRDDCQGETAMLFALDSVINPGRQSGQIAQRLLDFVYFDSDLCKGPRGDPRHPAFGLVAWGTTSPLWLIANYGDDNARSLLGTLMAEACLKTDRWDESLAKAILANFRTTGRLGFRGDRIDIPDLEKNGWRHYYDGDVVNCAPHFESYLWAVNLLAYRLTGFRPLLDRAVNAIAMTMKAYPHGWRWKDNIERARMLLCLAWLVRVEDTPEHREWLKRVAGDLLERQGPTGSIHEWLGAETSGFFQIPVSNEAYGTTETPLIQRNGDPATDQLYTTGFALFGLHEAAAATGDAGLRRAEDSLAAFLCRIQIRSAKFRWLDGWWFRAFDDHRWEAWASSADAGWGAWSLEAGWAPAWTAATFALRVKNTNFWDLAAAGSNLRESFSKWKIRMLPD
jgi:hypothetical protein